jgi:hypothetical protein
MDSSRFFACRLSLWALVLVCCLAAPSLAQPGDTTLAHVDGYLSISPDGRCAVLKQHDGSLLTLVGRWRGLAANDHVRLEGRLVPDTRCGGQGGFDVTLVQAIWADDNHRTTYYDHLQNGTFRSWAERYRPRELERYDRYDRRDRRYPGPPPG